MKWSFVKYDDESDRDRKPIWLFDGPESAFGLRDTVNILGSEYEIISLNTNRDDDTVIATVESVAKAKPKEAVDHPAHYGGKNNPYEAIKVIEAWGLGFCVGNAVKYLARAGKKDPAKELEDLKKAVWYLQYEIESRSQ